MSKKELVLDIETTGLSPEKDRITVVGVYTEGFSKVYRNLDDLYNDLSTTLAEYNLYGHNFTFDLRFLLNNGAPRNLIDRWSGDTQIMAHVVSKKVPEEYLLHYEKLRYIANKKLPQGTSHRQARGLSLKVLAPYFLGVDPFWEDPSNHDSDEYVLKDCEYTYRLLQTFKTMMKEEEKSFYETKMMPWAKMLLRTSERGLIIQPEVLTEVKEDTLKLADKLQNSLESVWAKAYKAYAHMKTSELAIKYKVMTEKAIEKAKNKDDDSITKIKARYKNLYTSAVEKSDFTLNLDSSAQLKWLLKDFFGHDILDMEGKETTGKAVLQRLSNEGHADIELFLEYKKTKKIATGFIPTYTELSYKNVIRPSFNLTGTRTGRLSCIEENQLVSGPGYEKPIKDIKEGDIVYSFHKNGELTEANVLAVLNNGPQECWKFMFNNDTLHLAHSLVCTPNHLLLTAAGSWKKACDLTYGDKVIGLTEDNSEEEFTYVKATHIGISNVYDLEIDNTFNFIASKICVHNCSSPNLQQIPSTLYKLFKPREGYTWLQYDYSSIEAKLIALYSEDSILNTIVAKGGSLHDYNAKALFNLSCKAEEVPEKYPNERKIAKTIGFSILYGAGPRRIRNAFASAGVIITEEEAKQKHKSLCDMFVDAKQFHRDVTAMVEAGEKLYNLLGRPLHINYEDAYMKAFNSLIQSSASDLLLEGTHRALKEYEQKKIEAYPLAFIHDFILIEVKLEQAEEANNILVKSLTEFNLTNKFGRVTLNVEGKIDTQWTK